LSSWFSGLDLVVFVAALATVMLVGLLAARNESSTADYFLAGRQLRWWGVAGSIFGTNVSANHLVGMLGIGYSIGFAQSHFELGAVAALLLLCYGFLPVYRRLGVYTLSEYLGRRYDARSQALYAVLMIVLVVVQLTAAFYIGSRSLVFLLGDTPLALSYGVGVAALAVLTGAYTIFGGLKAVVFTDVVQSVLLLAAGIVVAVFTLQQPEVGGWAGMMAQDAARPLAEQKMHLYLPSDHPDLPWTGALTGLLLLHCFYWSTNQYVVQRALAARSDGEARIGILAAGYLKLLVPFFAVGGGVAASLLFQARAPDLAIDPDAALPHLVTLVIPAGYGLVGLIMAGVLGAILSSIDSMVNSAATLLTFDVYKKWIAPDADDKTLLSLGRWAIVVLITVSGVLAVGTYAPDAKGNFFLRVSSMSGHFTPGLLVVFGLGMFWQRASAAGSVAAIVTAPAFSIALETLYNQHAQGAPALVAIAGTSLNFMHRVLFTAGFATAVHVVVSLRRPGTPHGAGYTVAALQALPAGALRRVGRALLGCAAVLGLLGAAVAANMLATSAAAILAAAAVAGGFAPFIAANRRRRWWTNDQLWAGLLSAITAALMFLFF
jgi:solute:Na+ symporter, SSS family